MKSFARSQTNHSWLRTAWLAMAVTLCSTSYGHAQTIPEDQITHKVTKEVIQGKILSFTPTEIRFVGKTTVYLQKDYAITRCDGFTNDKELLDAATKPLSRYQAHLQQLELIGPAYEEGKDIDVKRDRLALREVLKRIRKESLLHPQALALLGTANALDVGYARSRFEYFQEIRDDSDPLLPAVMASLSDRDIRALDRAIESTKVPCQKVMTRAKLKGQPANGQEACTKYESDLAKLRAVVIGSKPLEAFAIDAATSPEMLTQFEAELDKQLQHATQGAELVYLPEGVRKFFEARQEQTATRREQVGLFVKTAAPVETLRSMFDKGVEKLALQQNPNTDTIKSAFDPLRDQLATTRKDLEPRAATPAGKYALARLDALESDLDRLAKDFIWENLFQRARKEVEAARVAKTLEETNQARAALEKQLADLNRTTIPSDKRTSFATVLASTTAALFDVRLLNFGFQLEGIQDQIQDASESTKSMRIRLGQIASLENAWSRIKSDVDALKDPPVSAAKQLADIRRQISLTEDPILAAVKLSSVDDHLNRLPTTIDQRDVLQQATLSLTAAEEALKEVPIGVLVELRSQAVERASSAKLRLATATGHITFAEVEITLKTALEEVERALDEKRLLAARTRINTVGPEVSRVRALLDTLPILQEDPKFSETVASYEARQGALTARLDQEFLDKKRAHGWFALAMDERPLVAPAAENRLLQAELLAGMGKVEEARRALAAVNSQDLQPAAQAQHGDLKQKLEFQDALALEEAGELTAAVNVYEKIAASSGDNWYGQAAHFAARRAESQLSHIQDQRSNHWRLALVGVGLVAMAVGAVMLLRRDSHPVRLRNARRELQAAQAAARSGELERRDFHFRKAAALASGIPGGDLLVEQMRDVPKSSTVSDHLRLSPESDSDYITSALESADLQQGILICLEWLSSHSASEIDSLYQEVKKHLAKHLRPTRVMSPGELEWRAKAAAECAELLPSSRWPRYYELVALELLGEHQQADERAAQLKLADVAEKTDHEIQMVIAKCWFRLSRHADAQQLFKRLSKSNRVGEEAQQWQAIVGGDVLAKRNSTKDGKSKKMITRLLGA